MLNLTVIILTYNEEMHIKRCLSILSEQFDCKVVIVDSYSTDKTLELAGQYKNVQVFQNEWPGNQANQFNWALENISNLSDWILRLDADEYLSEECAAEIQDAIMREDVNGYYIKRRHMFQNVWIKRGIYPVRILRLFRFGFGLYSKDDIMDEHILLNGETDCLKYDFYDHSLISLKQFIIKHKNYAKREAVKSCSSAHMSKEKKFYYSFPPFLRAIMLWLYKYIFRLGFLAGGPAFIFFILQVLYYRLLIDFYRLKIILSD